MAEAESLLAISVDTKLIRAGLIEPVSGTHRLLAWQDMVANPLLPVIDQVAQTCQDLGNKIGRVLWNDVANRPLLHSKDPTRYPCITQVVGTASLHPPIRVWFAATSQFESMASALQVLDLCQALALGQTLLQSSTDISALEEELLLAEPDAVVIVGGYDIPDPQGQEAVLHLTSVILQAVMRIPDEVRPVILYAGNRYAAETVISIGRQLDQYQGDVDLFDDEQAPLDIQLINNVRPTPDLVQLAPLAQALRAAQQMLYDQSSAAEELADLLTSPAQLRTLETNFIQFTRGWMMQQRMDSLHALYCGSTWSLHIWARSGEEEVQICFAPPKEQPSLVAGWPAPQLVSGPWPEAVSPRPSPHWWDRNGLVPLLASIGQVAPLAMLQVIQMDLLEEAR